MAKMRKSANDKQDLTRNIRKQYENLFEKPENEPPASISIREAEALQARVHELEEKLAVSGAGNAKVASALSKTAPLPKIDQAENTSPSFGDAPSLLDSSQRASNIFRVSILIIILVLLSLPVYVYAAIRSGAWQVYAVVGSLVIALIFSITSNLLVRRKHEGLAIGLILWMVYLILPFINALLAGLSLVFSLTLFLIVAAIVGQTLSGRSATRGLLLGLLFAALTYLEDFFLPWDRLAIPFLQSYVPLVAAVAIILLGGFVLRPTWNSILLNISTGRKIALIVLVLVLGIFGVVAASVFGLQTMQYHVSNLYNFMLVPISTISSAEEALAQDQFIIQQAHTEKLSAAEVQQTIQNLQKTDTLVSDMLDRYQREWVTTTSPEFTRILQDAGKIELQSQEVATLNSLVASYGEYTLAERKFIDSLQTGQVSEDQAHNAIEKLQTTINDLQKLIVINNQFGEISNNAASSAYGQAGTGMGLVVVVALVIGLALSVLVVTSLTSRLDQLARGAAAFRDGSFNQTLTINGQDELSQLGRTFNEMAAQLKGLFTGLEQRVTERTHDLELATEVGRAVSEKVSNFNEMLSGAVELIRARFDLYYTQVYLLDSSGRELELQAGTGHVGHELLYRRHHLHLSSGSLNGRAVIDRRAVIVADTKLSANFLPNPLLPLTQSEMAVPLIAGDTVIGVLDMQSEHPNTFSETNLPAFEVLAGQLAIAIQNARLLQQAEEARMQVEAQARVLTSSGWREFLNAIDRGEKLGYVYDQKEVLPLTETQSPKVENPLVVPVKVAGVQVGEIHLVDEADHEWTMSEVQIALATASRVGQQIENLRLLAEAEHYRTAAEEVSRRLTREGWHGYLGNRRQLAAGYQYDRNQVQPLNGNGSKAPVSAYPLTIRNETIGELMVDEANKASTDIAEVVTAVAEQLSRHIENLRLLEETGIQRAKTDILYEISQKISAAKNRQEIVAAVSANINLPQINRAILLSYEYNESEELENIVVTANWYSGKGTPPTEIGRAYSPKVFTIVNFFDSAEPGFVGNTQTDPRVDDASKDVFKSQGIHAFISLPVWGDVRQTATLLLEAEEAIAFSPDEMTSYQSIMHQVSVALENQDLVEQTIKRANQLETVATLSTTASTVLDPDKLLQAVTDLTKKRFDLYHAHIYLADESWQTLLLAAGAGEVGRQLVANGHAISMNAEQSLVARAARTKDAVIVNNVRAVPDFLPNPLLPDTRAEMAVPMIVGEKVLGVFDVQSDRLEGFSSEDAAVYTTLASQVGVALQNARLYVEQAATVTQLRELDRLKSSFLANMSHELRTPLNSILGFADVMLEELDGPLTDNMQNDLGLIQKNGQHLLHLINDVLDMAKIEAGRMNLNPERFVLTEVLEEVTNITSTLASEKNLALFIEEDSDHDVEIYADRIRFRQVMINLINNAIKFTEKGKISISARPLDGAKVLIKVTDTGVGIPLDKQDAIFQEFTQVDASTTRKAGGTGLGLPISRRLVEMHGGRLWVESTGVPGEGSVFYVELPVEARINDVIEKQER